MTGILSMAIGLYIFGATHYITPSNGWTKYAYFVILVIARLLMGFGNGCLQASTSSIIAFNFPENMIKLFGIQ